jgi:transposase
MYLAKVANRKGTYLVILEAYRKDGRKTTKTIESLGYVETLKSKYPDPIAHFEQIVAERNAALEIENATETVTYHKGEKLSISNNRKNFGYAALSYVFHELELDKFFNNRSRSLKIQFNLSSVMKLLIYSRILRPASKQADFDNRGMFFDKMDFSLDDVYRSLTYVCKYKEAAQIWINEHIIAKYGRDTEFVFYDVTNYYFEIDTEDELRRKGVGKEHRPNPIVQMGLFMDNCGLPIAYRLFPGNNNDCTTLLPIIKSVRRNFGIGKAVVVADKGMNTSKNAYYLANNRGGYIFSQKVRGGAAELKNYVLRESSYEWNKDKTYKKKSRQFTRYVEFDETVDIDGGRRVTNTVRANISEKQIVFWSKDYQQKARADREKAIQKALDMIKDPSKYNKYNTYGAAKYVKNLEFGEDGEIVKLKTVPMFDYEKLADEEKYDGYYLIVTSRCEMPDDWAIDHYRGLWKIEETFKVTKSDLQSRPVYVTRQDHIEAHFLTCFIALVIIRILQKRLGGQFSTSSIIDSLIQSGCSVFETNRYLFDYFDEILKAIGDDTGISFDKKYRTLSEIRETIGDTKQPRH